MSKSTSVRVLPGEPSLDYLKKEAKRLLVSLQKTKPKMKLAEAQLALAREYGFSSWRVLKARVEALGVSQEMVKAFLFAVSEGDVPAVKAFIEKDARVVNATGPHPVWGGRPQGLHVAIEKGHQELFDLLLAKGASVEGDNAGYGWSPLWLAAHWKRDAMAKRLIQKGARVGFVEALMLGDDAGVERLMKESPEVIHTPMPGGGEANALHFVRSAKIARLLLERGLSLEAKDSYGRTPVETAAARTPADAELLAVLSKGGGAHPGVLAASGDLEGLKRAYKADPACLSGEYVVETLKLPLLNIAAEKGQLAVAAWLLDQGADVNRGNMNNATPLHAASWNGQVEVAKLLVERGANVEAKDNEYGATPMQWAQTALDRLDRAACADVMDYLESVTVQAKGKKMGKKTVKVADWKPIMDAAYTGDAAKIKSLVKAGADPNVLSTTNHRHRPLHRAAEKKKTYPRTEAHDAGVRALLEAGADPAMRAGYDNLTALAQAATGEIRFVPIMMERYRPDDIFHACVLADEARVKAILKKDPAQAKAIDENGWSALHYCTSSGMFEKGEKERAALVGIARMLIKGGADPMATYKFGDEWPIPALYGCCGKHDNPDVARVLFEAGATPYDQETVYHATDEGHAGVLKLIEEFTDKKKLAAECSRCLPTQLHWNHQQGMPWLLAHGADPNWQAPDAGETALHKAARNGANKDTIAMLLAHGAKVDVKNKKGQTPEDLAREAGKSRVVQQLRAAAKAGRK